MRSESGRRSAADEPLRLATPSTTSCSRVACGVAVPILLAALVPPFTTVELLPILAVLLLVSMLA